MSEANRNNGRVGIQANPQGLTYIFINNIARIWSKRTQDGYHLHSQSVTRVFVLILRKFVWLPFTFHQGLGRPEDPESTAQVGFGTTTNALAGTAPVVSVTYNTRSPRAKPRFENSGLCATSFLVKQSHQVVENTEERPGIAQNKANFDHFGDSGRFGQNGGAIQFTSDDLWKPHCSATCSSARWRKQPRQAAGS